MKGKRNFLGSSRKGTSTKTERDVKLETSWKTCGRKSERVSLKINGIMVSFVVANLLYTCNYLFTCTSLLIATEVFIRYIICVTAVLPRLSFLAAMSNPLKAWAIRRDCSTHDIWNFFQTESISNITPIRTITYTYLIIINCIDLLFSFH